MTSKALDRDSEIPPGASRDPGRQVDRAEQPPDLEELLGKFFKRLGSAFTDRPDPVNGGGGDDARRSGLPWLLILVIGLLVWLAQGFYTVDEQERGLVLRFGRHVQTLQPGLSLRFPVPIERVVKINVGQVRNDTHEATMLTRDENLVSVVVVVQWRIQNPEQYVFQINDPEETLDKIIESVVREVIGTSDLDFVLTEGRGAIVVRQQELMQKVLDEYHMGILIVRVEMQGASPPLAVKDAFDDAIKAREDEQRLVNESEAYRNDLLPRARGEAARMVEDANAYMAKVVARAQGESKRFLDLLGEYEHAPYVTRERLYLETLESVMTKTNKVLIDSDGNSLLMLPMDSLLRRREELPELFRGGQGPGTGEFSAADDSGARPERRRRRERVR